MSAGKASFESTLSIFVAAVGIYRRHSIPSTIGSNMVMRFCISRFPTGRCTPTAAPTYSVVHSMMIGTVNRVIIELTAVRDTDRATSPFASIEKILLDEPPGQHAMSITPIKNIGGNENINANAQAMIGRMMSCPNMPVSIALGRLAISTKSEGWSVRPSSNISNVSIGKTIRMLFIFNS